MLKRSFLAAALVVAFSTPAFAFYCPLNGKAIGEADMSRLSAAEQANVNGLRDEGMALHDSGDHAGAVTKLAEAMRILVSH